LHNPVENDKDLTVLLALNANTSENTNIPIPGSRKRRETGAYVALRLVWNSRARLDATFVENKENVCAQTLYLLPKLMLDVKVVRRAAISEGTQGSRKGIDVILSSLHDSGIDLLLTVASRVTLAPCYFKLLDRCSGCSTSYTMFSVFVYIYIYTFLLSGP